jgi:hypothetical protein
MHVRAIDGAAEFKRNDASFYKGIVVKNNDPEYLYRVKVYIPELSNQPLENWLQEYKEFFMRMPGSNNKEDSWGAEPDIYEEIAKFIPWAEPCFPLMGESGPGRYNAYNKKSTLSDTNYPDYDNDKDKDKRTPAWFWECKEFVAGDANTHAADNLANNSNPYAYLNRPSSYSDLTKGVVGVPNVGSKVWVFHDHGDLFHPVYFGVRRGFRETGLMADLDQFEDEGSDVKEHKSLDYASIFENIEEKDK